MLGIYLSIWVWGEWFILLFEMLDLTTGDLPPSVRSLQVLGSYYLLIISVESDSPCPWPDFRRVRLQKGKELGWQVGD